MKENDFGISFKGGIVNNIVINRVINNIVINHIIFEEHSLKVSITIKRCVSIFNIVNRNVSTFFIVYIITCIGIHYCMLYFGWTDIHFCTYTYIQ